MAVFGERYGQEFRVEASMENEGQVSCSASVKLAVEGALSVRESHGSAVVSKAVTNPSSSSSASIALGSVKEGGVAEEEVEPATRAASVREDTAIEEELLPITETKPALIPPLNEDENFMSGALPVEPVASEQAAGSARTEPAHANGAQVLDPDYALKEGKW